jgi:hypothetical protein
MRKIFLTLAAAAGLAYARLFGGPMDGTAWDIKIKPDSMFGFSHSGTLRFDKGEVSVLMPLADGFSPGVYRARGVEGPDGTVWSAALSEAQRGVLSWQGFVRGDEIQGIAVLWRPDGKPQRFLFKGTRKSA